MTEVNPPATGGLDTTTTAPSAAATTSAAITTTASMAQIVAMHQSMQQLLTASNMLPTPAVASTSRGNNQIAVGGSISGSCLGDDYDPDSFLELDDPLAQYTKGILIKFIYSNNDTCYIT